MNTGEFKGLNLGGVLNSGFSLSSLLLFAGAGFAISAGFGAFLVNGKKHSELVLESKKERENMQQLFESLALQQAGRGGPGNGENPLRRSARGAPAPNPNAEMQNLQLIITKLMNDTAALEIRGKYNEAILTHIKVIEICAQLQPQVIPQLQAKLLSLFEKSGDVESARQLLEELPAGDSPLEQIDRLLTLARYGIIISDSKTLDHLDKALQIADSIGSTDHITAITKMKGDYYVEVQRYKDAEIHLREALKLQLESKEEGKNLSRETLRIFLELQKMFTRQGKPQIAMEIDENEIKPNTNTDYDDISYFWHLTHLAYIFIEQDYPQFAEQVWNRVIDQYEESYNEIQDKKVKSDFEKRVLSIVTNTKNEMGVMYYNQGKLKLFQDISDELCKHQYILQTTSKFFTTTRSTIIENEDGEGVQIVLELSVGNKFLCQMSDISSLRFYVEFGGEKNLEREIDFDSTSKTIVLLSKPKQEIVKGAHLLNIEVVMESFGSESTYSHLQYLHVKETIKEQ